MHFSYALIALASSTLPFLSHASTEDILNIQKLNADFAIFDDQKAFSSFDQIFTQNISFDYGTVCPRATTDLASLQATFGKIYANGTLSHNLLGTNSISLADQQGAASSATQTIYGQTTFFPQGNTTGLIKILSAYYRYEDHLINTGEQGYGGWRIDVRKLIYFVQLVEQQGTSGQPDLGFC